MPALLDTVDPDGLLEYSVVYTDRSLNHMSSRFQSTMRELHATLIEVYQASAAVIVPGSGSFGMEAVARQFARRKRVLIVRNGWFSYRWSQILEQGGLCAGPTVLKARFLEPGRQSPIAPPPIEELVETIRRERPEVVFAPHVETSAGLMLPNAYLEAIGEAVREVDGLFVLDCVASGTEWIDMRGSGVDVLVTAPQKGWSGTPCAGVVMLGERAVGRLADTSSDSFTLDLARWRQIMQAYLDGKHAYHATMPTDGLVVFRDVMNELAGIGFETLRERQRTLGRRIRESIEARGFRSLAAESVAASGVAVYYTDDDTLHSGRAFAEAGVQIAAGVPLQIGEPEDFKTFRIGLFGIDKLTDVDAAVARFERALSQVARSGSDVARVATSS